MPSPRLLLPAPDAAVRSSPAVLPPAVQRFPAQASLPLPSGTVQPGLAAAPQLHAGNPAMQPLPGQPLPWPLGQAHLPPPSARLTLARPQPRPPATLGSLPLPAYMPGTNAGPVPQQQPPHQPPQQHPAGSEALAGSMAPAADRDVSLQTHAAASPNHAAAAAAPIGDPLAVPAQGSQAPQQQRQDAAAPAPMETDAATTAPAPVVSGGPTPQHPQQQIADANSGGPGGIVSAPSEPPPAPATVLSEGRAAALSALDRALGILPPSAAADQTAFTGGAVAPSTGAAAWLPAPLPSAVLPVMSGVAPPFGFVPSPGQACRVQVPAVAAAPRGVQAAMAGPGGPGKDRGAIMDEEVRRLRADMAERARLQEERERRLAEVHHRSRLVYLVPRKAA